jgi:hypothetical protein
MSMKVCGDKTIGNVPPAFEQTDVTEEGQTVTRSMKKKGCKGGKRH